MSAAETQNFLSPDSELPPDVFFHVEDEEGQSRTIGAHRFILAAVSPVFRGMFLGSIRETGEVVEVKETTVEAFNTMVNYIYNPPGGDTFNLSQIRCPQKLFELLTLANKYEILKLAMLISDALGSLAITRKNMIFAATIAKQYKEVFADVSNKLSMRCLKFLFDTTRGGGDVCALIKETVDNFPGANLNILRELISVGTATLQLPGWGHLVYFDTAEHKTSEAGAIAKIPKLGAEWKIIHEFKPTRNIQEGQAVGLSLVRGEWPHLAASGSICVGIFFLPGDFLLLATNANQGWWSTGMVEHGYNPRPEVGEWTKIEIGHEKVGERYFLSLSVGGREVGRKEVKKNLELRKLTDVEVCIGIPEDRIMHQPGFIRRLVVLEK